MEGQALAPEDISPYQCGDNCNGYTIYNSNGPGGESFFMAGEEYTSGFTANGKLDGMFLFTAGP